MNPTPVATGGLRADMLKCVIWGNMPSHHQCHFFEALRNAGVDLRVCYYGRVSVDRIALGWGDEMKELPDGEELVGRSLDALGAMEDWQGRIHVIPGYGDPFLRGLVRTLSQANVNWVHWSESARKGMRWVATYPIKRWHARMVNKYALGAFGAGLEALADFRRWGIRTERMALLPYAVAGGNQHADLDEPCADFCCGRPAFLCLGVLCKRKATDVLLQSFATVAQVNREWVLLLVGNDRSNGRYAREAKRLGIEKRVLFRGSVSAKHVSSVLKAARVLILPSRFDGWGAALNEGASMGLALVGSNKVGAAYHLIEPGENGFRVQAASVGSLAQAMRAYMVDPRLATLHGTHSLKVFEAFTPRRNARRFINSIQSWQAMATTKQGVEHEMR